MRKFERMGNDKRKTIAMTVFLVTLGLAILLACDEDTDSNGPTFPGRRDGENDWELLFSWEEWGDPDYVPHTPVWSPDCNRIVYNLTNYNFNPHRKMLIYDLETAEFSEIENTSPFPAFPKWSPDGEWIFYFSSASDYMSNWIIHPDGTDNTVVFGSHGAPGVHGYHGNWAPDGKSLCFEGNDLAELDGLIIADINDLEDIEYNCALRYDDDDYWSNIFTSSQWSPGSGEFIVYERLQGEYDVNEIAITNPEGEYSDTLIPANSDYPIYLCDWSPDGRYLLLKIHNQGFFDLWAYELKTGEFIQITFNDEDQSGIDGASWGSNGKIVFDYGITEYDAVNDDYIHYVSIYTVDALK